MYTIGEEILAYSNGLPEGTVLSARAFLHLGSRAAIDQALSRLARSGEFLRVERGRYVRSVATRFGVRAPAPEKVVEGLAALSGETVVPSGAVAANALGLTTQVPVRPVFLTSGGSRRLRLGKQVVELKHAPAWQLNAAGRTAGQAVRALAWLGPSHAPAAAMTLKQSLSREEIEELVNARGGLPMWLAKTVSDAFVARPKKAPVAGL